MRESGRSGAGYTDGTVLIAINRHKAIESHTYFTNMLMIDTGTRPATWDAAVTCFDLQLRLVMFNELGRSYTSWNYIKRLRFIIVLIMLIRYRNALHIRLA